MGLKNNILCISHGSTLNGAERVFYELVKSLNDLNYNVTAIFPNQGPLILKCKKHVDNCIVIDIPWWLDRGQKLTFTSKVRSFFNIIKGVLNLLKIMRKLNPDIVITNTIAIPSGSIAAFILRKKHIWYIHEFGKEDHNFNFIFGTWLSGKLISNLSNRVIINSLAVQEKYKKFINNKKLKMLYYAVEVEVSDLKELNSEIFSDNNPMKVVIIGRVSISKGQMEAIKAIEYLVIKKRYYVTLTIIGANFDNYSNEIRNYIKKNKIEKYINLIDFNSDPLNLVLKFDICLNCSINEAFGRITIEAMKVGLPVIASDMGGNLELIKIFDNGLLYKQGNYFSLSEKVEYFYLNSKEINRMGLFAQTWAKENFNLVKYKKDINNIIRQVI